MAYNFGSIGFDADYRQPTARSPFFVGRAMPFPHSLLDGLIERFEQLFSRLKRIEDSIDVLVSQKTIKDWYTTDEVADIVGRAPFTVREWCRLGRLKAIKRLTGRGNTLEWIIGHEELQRLRNHGLLPIPKYRHDG